MSRIVLRQKKGRTQVKTFLYLSLDSTFIQMLQWKLRWIPFLTKRRATVTETDLRKKEIELDLQSAGSSPNLTYTKISALDAIRIP